MAQSWTAWQRFPAPRCPRGHYTHTGGGRLTRIEKEVSGFACALHRGCREMGIVQVLALMENISPLL